MRQTRPDADDNMYENGDLPPTQPKPDLIYAQVERDIGETPYEGEVPTSREIPNNNEIFYSELQPRLPPPSHDVYANI